MNFEQAEQEAITKNASICLEEDANIVIDDNTFSLLPVFVPARSVWVNEWGNPEYYAMRDAMFGVIMMDAKFSCTTPEYMEELLAQDSLVSDDWGVYNLNWSDDGTTETN